MYVYVRAHVVFCSTFCSELSFLEFSVEETFLSQMGKKISLIMGKKKELKVL